MNPMPNALLDASATWVKWVKLASFTNYDIMRYEPR
jgi:hypothetical protein